MGLRDRLEKLERSAPPSVPAASSHLSRDLEEYFAVLEGAEVEERYDPRLEDYFESLGREQEEIERRRCGLES